MSFRILYIEDDDFLATTIKEQMDKPPEKGRQALVLERINSPDLLDDELKRNHYDVILADVCFPPDDTDRLDDIIEKVERWCRSNGMEDRLLPIIAYTRRGKGSLVHCIKRRESLYDIWDKVSASPVYAAWRMACLSVELPRTRPDALLIRMIRQMPTGAPWHAHVKDMATRYAAGWTEADQVHRVEHAIGNIASQLGVVHPVKAYWELMEKWEYLSRGVSTHIRGHARHVINVFWLGYYLLHHPVLKPTFAQIWTRLVDDRSDMSSVKAVDPLEALSTCWFYAALFHDIANSVQKRKDLFKQGDDVLNVFGTTLSSPNGIGRPVNNTLRNTGLRIVEGLDGELASLLTPKWKQSMKDKRPDHGVVAAAHLVKSVTDSPQNCYAREAARAMATHNLMGELPPSYKKKPLSWNREPLACLLVLCDQIQTWDRETNATKEAEPPQPDRAELSEFAVTTAGAMPKIDLTIEYITPRHLDYAPKLFALVKDNLENILQTKPGMALGRIRDWPFAVDVRCRLGGEPLEHPMHFGV